MIRVLLADDQAMVRAGFRLILSAEPDITVVGEAADGVEAVAAARRLRPGRHAHGHPDAAAGRHRRDPPADRRGRRPSPGSSS